MSLKRGAERAKALRVRVASLSGKSGSYKVPVTPSAPARLSLH